jgi:addiction module antitoxin, RelB/DinJ family
MAKDAMIRARIEPELKARVEILFDKLGLTTTEAITLFYRQVELRRGLPFPIEIPNEVTVKTFEETDRVENLNRYKDAERSRFNTPQGK